MTQIGDAGEVGETRCRDRRDDVVATITQRGPKIDLIGGIAVRIGVFLESHHGCEDCANDDQEKGRLDFDVFGEVFDFPGKQESMENEIRRPGNHQYDRNAFNDQAIPGIEQIAIAKFKLKKLLLILLNYLLIKKNSLMDFIKLYIILISVL